jgi:hypothetical protein
VSELVTGVNELDNRWASVVVSRCCEKVVAEAMDRGRETSAFGSHYQVTTSGD